MKTITFISDTHGSHESLRLSKTDILIHCGDFTKRGNYQEVTKFLNWFVRQPHPYKVFIGGNHDFLLEQDFQTFQAILPKHLIYLENDMVEIEGLKIWGSPITPTYHNMAFNRDRGAQISKYWEAIPEGIDVLITHGPPFGILDKTISNIHAGCEDLLEELNRIRPRYHVFGHIHEHVGVEEKNGTTFINACNVNLRYKLVYKPVTIEIT